MDRGNGQFVEQCEYVLVPLDADRGEIDIRRPDGSPLTVEVSVADLDDGLTVVGAPADADSNTMHSIVAEIQRSAKERGQGRHYVVVRGQLNERWRFLRMVRRDKWDDVFGEES